MENVITVGVKIPQVSYKELYNSLDELSRLANTAGGEVFTSYVQNRAKFDSAYFIGEGKAREIGEVAKNNKITTVIFNDELSPTQQRNLEELMDVKIIDRTRLILDIFAHRARTSEAELQIELAQMSYYLPRLNQKGVYLDNQLGGIGTKGPGERKLEYDRRRLRDKISFYNKQIDKIKYHRKVQKARRKNDGIPVVAIVGYTNAGKSTLLNRLVSSLMKKKENAVYADDKLFATLDPTTRRIVFPSGKEILMTDTVGFINKLPHQLIASFRSTLEEIADANCILIVNDLSNPDYQEQEKIVNKTIAELDIKGIPIIYVNNKSDLLPKDSPLADSAGNNGVTISAKTSQGISVLLDKIEKVLYTSEITRVITVKYNKPNLMDFIFSRTKILEKTYKENHLKIKIQTDSITLEKIRKLNEYR
ncbi:MAG: GTPase HflX [Elusimicrobia bacterium RIFOXYA2_FULL_39_19]|nr:MAG: GTPase HflX [Elusimicrobia bacterium RIFOXYA2_FULL_39_19]